MMNSIIEQSGTLDHLFGVRMVQKALLLILAIVWLPVTSHCLLFQSVATPDSVSCCSPGESPAPSSPDKHDCATDTCASVEGARYKSSLQRVTVPPFLPQIVFDLPQVSLDTPTAEYLRLLCHSDGVVSSRLLDWRFEERTALPPRAPSFLS